MNHFDLIIIGGGAAGQMAAISAKKLGLGEDDLEQVFEEVLKLMSTNKNKKGET